MVFGIIFVVLSVLFIVYYLGQIRQSPDGKMELKTALALKLLKDYRGDDIFEVRENYKTLSKKDYSKKLPLPTVKNFTLESPFGQIPVRLYASSDNEKLPLIVFIHGGGWCIGNLDTHDQQCRRIAISSGYPILSIDYTLSPEAKFPQAVQEVAHIMKQFGTKQLDIPADPSQLIVMGDSAGGNMAITTTLKLIQDGVDISFIKCLVPVYPVTDCTDSKGGSFIEFQDGYILTKHLMDLFSSNYVAENQDPMDPLLSPLYSKNLDKLPPCFVLTAGLDPLRDEGETFAKKLTELGNVVQLKRYDACVHSFYGQEEFGKNGPIAVEDTVQFINKYVNI